jgi:hypothetical protein
MSNYYMDSALTTPFRAYSDAVSGTEIENHDSDTSSIGHHREITSQTIGEQPKNSEIIAPVSTPANEAKVPSRQLPEPEKMAKEGNTPIEVSKMEEKTAAELSHTTPELPETEKQRQEEEKKAKEEEEKKAKEEEEKKAKEEQERIIHDAYVALRNQMLLVENATLQRPVPIPKEELVDGKAKPFGKSIVLLTAHDGGGGVVKNDNINEMAIENRKEYASYHGYGHHFVNMTKYKQDDPLQRPAAWYKIPAIREVFDTYPEVEWVWWLDMDAMITNEQVDLASHILNRHVLKERLTYDRPMNDIGTRFSGKRYFRRNEVDVEQIDLIFAQDGWGLNAGSFFIRNSQWSRFLLDIWEDPLLINMRFSRKEQDSYLWLMDNHETVLQHTGLVPQRLVNAYTEYEVPFADWRDGDFVVHFPGKDRGEWYQNAWTKFWGKRIRPSNL